MKGEKSHHPTKPNQTKPFRKKYASTRSDPLKFHLLPSSSHPNQVQYAPFPSIDIPASVPAQTSSSSSMYPSYVLLLLLLYVNVCRDNNTARSRIPLSRNETFLILHSSSTVVNPFCALISSQVFCVPLPSSLHLFLSLHAQPALIAPSRWFATQ